MSRATCCENYNNDVIGCFCTDDGQYPPPNDDTDCFEGIGYFVLLPIACIVGHGLFTIAEVGKCCDERAKGQMDDPGGSGSGCCFSAPAPNEMERYAKEAQKTKEVATDTLMKAIKSGDLVGVRDSIRSGADANKQLWGAKTPLHLAAEGGNTEIVQHLVSNGVYVNSRAKDDVTPLHIAASRGNSGAVAMLLESKADVGARTASAKRLPLHLAAINGDLNVIKLLLNAPGCEVDPRDKALNTPFIEAAREGRLEVMKALLDAKADPTAVNAQGEGASHAALRGKQLHVVHFLEELSKYSAPTRPPMGDSRGLSSVTKPTTSPGSSSRMIPNSLSGKTENKRSLYPPTRPEDSLVSTNTRDSTTTDPVLKWIGSNSQEDDVALPKALRSWQFSWKDVEITSALGLGSFGKVFLAKLAEATVAVKVLIDAKAVAADAAGGSCHSALTSDTMAAAAPAKLAEEAELLASMRHPNIVAFMGFCTSPPAIATEFCARGSVADVLKAAADDSSGSGVAADLTWSRRLEMASDAATGMLHLHTRSPVVLHRDLKSLNLLVSADWTVKIADLGLSKVVEDAGKSAGSTMSHVNPRWLAPELFTGNEASTASDVYAFGLVMWELLAWKLPWSDINQFMIPMKVTSGERPPVPLYGSLPGMQQCTATAFAQYVVLMEQCWTQDPQKRPSFQQIITELKGIKCL